MRREEKHRLLSSHKGDKQRDQEEAGKWGALGWLPGRLSGGLCAGTNVWAAQRSSEFLHWPRGHLSPSSLLGRTPHRSVGIFKDLNFFFFFYKLILFLLISNIIKLMLLILRSMSLGILS